MSEALYTALADWWPLLSAPSDYEEEAGFYSDILRRECNPQTVLELGSGGGNNALFMKQRFKMTLADLSPQMLAVSRALNPECEHVQGDMRELRLGRVFDAVFVHDAICYMATRADLLLAMQTAAAHCRPGGAVLLCPDETAESFKPATGHGGEDGQGRAMRYLEWTRDENPDDEQIEADYAFILHERGKPSRVLHERHIHGLFKASTWIELAAQAGFAARQEFVNHTGVGETPVFVGRRV